MYLSGSPATVAAAGLVASIVKDGGPFLGYSKLKFNNNDFTLQGT